MNVDKKGLYNLVGGPPSTTTSATAGSSSTIPTSLRSAPPPVPDTLIAFPRPHVLLVTLNRPAHLNAVTRAQHAALHRLWTWFDAEPWLRCAVVTGGGGARAFSAGADLKEWDGHLSSGEGGGQVRREGGEKTKEEEEEKPGEDHRAASGGSRRRSDDDDDEDDHGGFGGLSNRKGKKPVLAAVNGLCLGGAMEMVLNADMVLAREGATFGLPEVRVGVVAVAGALPRLVRTAGRQRAAEMALLGGTDYTAEEMRAWGIVNRVVRAAPSSSSSSSTSPSSSPSTREDSTQSATTEKKNKREKRGFTEQEQQKRQKQREEKEAEAAARATVDEALRWAGILAAECSPDSVIVSREGLLGGWEAEDPQASTRRVAGAGGPYRRMDGGDNMREGVRAFVEKRKPAWQDSKL
ncbi:hypothetical protein JDV02_003264 [Purpureocillium takamizusanense]|uniref:Enoyl-CoA hydratase/isomerase domain-containing protein n=1 Tax=Purpureocillium takamizusanense TaxID=2060973 RepID=A0A9Q8QDR5_9HYPO|nr:uncharacterized protein JDV02_003264 [Purpureocillium takamizusanense]UNI16867.1 hypothetical protein JDV02_003264 [Purpureocillium takamizusanense]